MKIIHTSLAALDSRLQRLASGRYRRRRRQRRAPAPTPNGSDTQKAA